MKIMVSACLFGDKVKYDGNSNYNEELVNYLKEFEIIKVCPEVMGGLSIPRIPSEIRNNKVINKEGRDVSNEFILGANKTLEIAKKNDVRIAILKNGSPSCGSTNIYDGTFTNNKINGQGITAKLLMENGIKVLNENNYQEYLKKSRI